MKTLSLFLMTFEARQIADLRTKISIEDAIMI